MKKFLLCLVLFIPFNVKAFGTSAKAAILMDMDSGRVLYGKDINYVQSVASISKIMTAICVIENMDLEDDIIVGDEVLKAYGSGIYVQIGEKLKVKDLLYGLMMRSGNDAAIVLAKNAGGSVKGFANIMNMKAKKLGMKNTIFNNPTGLDEEDDGNLSSPYDMALLMSYAMKNKKFRKIVSVKTYTLKTNKNVYKWKNKNKLLYSYRYTIGGKTGYTKKAKRTLVTAASKDNLNLVAVTINDGNDFKDHTDLFEEAFKTYKNYLLLNKGKLHIIGENYYNDKLYIRNKITYPLSAYEENVLKLKFELNKARKYKNNMRVGVVKVYLGDLVVKKEDIYVKVKS